jgi:DNA repair and recombination protein RAD54B
MFKPFKPPLLKEIEKTFSIDLTVSDSEAENHPRPNKKRKLLIHTVEAPVKTFPPKSQAANAPRKPLLVVRNPTNAEEAVSSPPEEGHLGYYRVLWYVYLH